MHFVYTALSNYQILLLVQLQVNGQKFICPNKIYFARKLTLFLFLAAKQTIYIVRLSLLTMTNPNQLCDVLLFVCSMMADETNLSSKLLVADRTRGV